ncbi:hypothetical protein HDU67_004551 [Dinochytrium kinnereticum]|nr:hypothetical protein HDU67_004551 [Dinochytrium kinnereticum]
MADHSTVESTPPAFHLDAHVKFIVELDTKKDELEYWMSEHLRLNGVYWGLTALALMKSETALGRDDLIAYVLSCQTKEAMLKGSFGGHVGYDGHLLYTLSAIQILVTLDALDRIDTHKVVEFVKSLQNPDGSFCGDKWGEVDTRFSYCALSCLSILGRMDAVDVKKAVEFVDQCKNFDGAYGSIPGAESHAAYAFADALDLVDADKLGWWLAERQLNSGGLNGRPEKLADVCYSWWVLSSLSILNRVHWISGEKLVSFILQSQDTDGGGIADRPGDAPDVFHTLFGIAGLSLLGFGNLEKVDPRYCMPASVVDRLGLQGMDQKSGYTSSFKRDTNHPAMQQQPQQAARVMVDPRFVTTAPELPGYRIVQCVGVCRGLTVRNPNAGKQIFAGFASCEKARATAMERLQADAAQKGANAIVGMFYDTQEIAEGMTECLAYGTGVVIAPA